jgi:hypothetical protein
MTSRRDAFPASPVNARLSWALRLALLLQCSPVSSIDLLFVGKTSLEDQRLLAHFFEEGLLVKPHYMPHQFRDLAALSCWMCYSLFFNQLDLNKLAVDYRNILQG